MNDMTSNQIEVRLRELSQLFNSMDPSPFIDRDLDAAAEEFIVNWAREMPHKAELELVIHLATRTADDKLSGVEEAVRHYFSNRAEMKQQEFRQLMRLGRTNLFIGLIFAAACFGLGVAAQRALPGPWSEFADFGLQVVGWVALWRPLEIFLYDWWPIRSDQHLLERLARMKVRLNQPAA